MQEPGPAQYALIVEDHPLVADSLVACVHACDAGLETVVAESLGAALRILAARPAPPLILTDLTLTDAQDTEAVRRLREASPQSALLVVTALDDPQLRTEAQALGALRYLMKSTSIPTLREEIQAIIGGRSATHAVATRHDVTANGLLTPKQIAVLEELVAGRSNKEIAARMGIGDATVSSHMKEILGRLGAKNRTEAVVRYLQMLP